MSITLQRFGTMGTWFNWNKRHCTRVVTMGIPSLHLGGENINYTVVKGNIYIYIWPRFLLQWTFIIIKSSIRKWYSRKFMIRKLVTINFCWIAEIELNWLDIELTNLKLTGRCFDLQMHKRKNTDDISLLPTRHTFLSSGQDIGQQPVIYYILLQR